jgi:hypothetical protein
MYQNCDAIPRLGIVQNILKNLITPFLQEKTKENRQVSFYKSGIFFDSIK